MTTNSTQASQILPNLFRDVDESQRLRVLHLGPACQDTIDFFSDFRCRLRVIDLFADLPIPPVEETENGLEAHFRQLLQLDAQERFHLCLFWDLFNYLDAPALAALLSVLAPNLADGCLGHGFSVHNPRTPENQFIYGIRDNQTISLRPRPNATPGYAPHSQNRLTELLQGLKIERSVLLSDRRLGLLMRSGGGREPVRRRAV